MSKERILIIEDDKHISRLVKYNLEKAGYFCFVAGSAEEAFETLDREALDMVVLDIMLPKVDGFEICKQMKQIPALARLPVLMLTARGEEVDRIVGFELGADDYMVKPFSPRELVLRIKAILKRSQSKKETNPKEILTAGDLKIDIPRHKVTVEEKEVVLTAMEFKLLITLLSRQGRVQSREQLLNDVWEMGSDVTTRTIDTHVKRLRQKLGDAGDYVETVRGLGYRFKEMDD